MYLATVLLTMFVLPLGSIVTERLLDPEAPLLLLMGRWFVFWVVGVRLTLAGVRQVVQPAFTARQIFHMQGDEVYPVIRELGIANLASAIVGLTSLSTPLFVLPASLSAAFFFGVAGLRHAMVQGRSGKETIAMVSDLFVAIVFAVYVGAAFLRQV